MNKAFSLSNDKVMINFTALYCDTYEKLLSSDGFKRVLDFYLRKIEDKHTIVYKFLKNNLNCPTENMSDSIATLFKLLIGLNKNEIAQLSSDYSNLLSNKKLFIDFTEDLYSFWRKLERYTIIQNVKVNEGLEKASFIDANQQFSKMVLELYRKIEENILGYSPNVYRQLPAGGNAGMVLTQMNWKCPEEYKALFEIPFIESILLDPPFISYPKKNTRDGFFNEVYENPINDCQINPDHWFCYPAKVGTLTAFIFFHRDFMAHGIALCNLFELARKEEYCDKVPDIIYVFGARDDSENVKTVFYDDKINDIMFGYVNYNEAIDYFGYMKKMTLTLHNLIMIKKGYLPIHGAMVCVNLKDGGSANIIFVGDSGAGKSETLEAFRNLSEKYISDMTVIFDDMGVIKIKDTGSAPLAYGTEIGAFVRLDDLDIGYAFKELDRSIFMNPDKINARLVIPITSYSDVVKGYPFDMILYANNYEAPSEDKKELEFFSDINEAINTFKAGKRMAKGTTTENGLVQSYFANPFGPLQKQAETDILLEKYFNAFYSANIKVGQIRTSLAIPGLEKHGPQNAALNLFKAIKELKK